MNQESNFTSLLFLVFLVLKLTNQIDWSWWWVTSPIWIPILFSIVILTIIEIAEFFNIHK